MAADLAALYQRKLDNLARIGLMLTEAIANPTQAAIDALAAASEGSGLVMPKIDTSVDGESYSWGAFQAQFEQMFADCRKMLIRLQGPSWTYSTGR